MSDDVPAPPAETPPSGPGPAAAPLRSGLVTAAGVLLIVAGALGVLGGFFLLAGAGVAAGAGVGGLFLIIGISILVIGALEIYAGIQVLGLHERGRVVGIVLAAVGALFSLLSIARTPGSSIIGLAIDVFIIYALVSKQSEFHA